MIKVIAFDLDDTLWHVDPVIIRAEQILKDWLIEHVPGFPYDMHYMNQFRKQVLADQPKLAGRVTEFRRRVIVNALIHHGRTDSTKIATEAMQVFWSLAIKLRFLMAPSDHGVVAQLYRLGAITNGNADIFKLVSTDVQFCLCAEEVGLRPAPDLFHQSPFSHWRLRQWSVWGDCIKDIDAAKAIGIKTSGLETNDERGPAIQNQIQ